jgi:hypothetical protein
VLGTTVSAREQIVWEIVQMIVLPIEDSLLRACHLRRRYRRGSNKGQGHYGMACTEECLIIVDFMGLAGYYRRFIEGFSKISNPITKLQKKNKKFIWTEKCVESSRRLKELLITTPILKVPDMDADFLVCTHASKEGLGKVLMQDSPVISYISRKLRRNEENYAMHDLELLAIVYDLKVWRHYLVGKKIELRMNHYGLEHIFTQSDLNARQRRWSELLSEYDFEISYIKGTMNRVADELIQRPCIFLVLPLQMNLR